MANIREIFQKKLTRRDALKAAGLLGGAALLTGCKAIEGASKDIRDSRKAVGNWVAGDTQSNEGQSDVKSTTLERAGDLTHPEARSIKRPKQAPYLPKTEKEISAYGEKNGWDRAVFNRVIMLPSDHSKDHVKEWREAVLGFGKARGWGDITAWENTWVYPMMLTAGLEDIKKNKQVQVMSNGKMVDIDPIRVDNWAIAANVIDRGNPKMAVYMVPWVAGEVHARLPQDTTESEITMAFALNQYNVNLKTEGNKDVVPAIIMRGVATAPVSILYGRPTDDKGGFELRAVETRLEPLTGNVTVHLPKEGFKGDHAPFVIIRMPVVANNPKGETEVIFVPGSDVLPTNPKWAEKHRITEEMLKAGKLVAQ